MTPRGTDAASTLDTLDGKERFTSRVDDYVRYRPGYPPALARWLTEHVGAGREIVDVGAGTGISSRMLLDEGHTVVAVEPNEAMRGAALQHLAAEAERGRVRVVAGSAEATSLPDGSADVITSAQSFHWFDQEAIKPEWRRVLRPGGVIAIFWNSRRLTGTPFLDGYERLLLDYGLDYTSVSERYADDEHMRRWFGARLRAEARFPHTQALDYDGLRGRLASSSYAPRADHPRYAATIDALRALFEATSEDGRVSFDYDTRVFLGDPP